MASCRDSCRSCKSGWDKFMAFVMKHQENVLLGLLVLFMVIGIIIGVLLREVQPPLNAQQVMYLGFPGELLMRMLKMMILPLIVASLIAGLANLDIGSSGRMGGRAVLYYMSTTFFAVVLGIILVMSIQPGFRADVNSLEKSSGAPRLVITSDKILDLVRSIFPDNLVTAAFTQVQTTYTEYDCDDPLKAQSVCNDSTQILSIIRENTTIYYTAKVENKSGLNILGLLVFSIAFGIVLGSMGEQAKPLKDFFNCLSEVSMKIVHLIIWYSPIGVCFLIAAKLTGTPNLGDLMISLAYYMLTVLVGLFIHGLIVIPILYLIFVRKNPFKYLVGIIQALVTAFATASSSATMPVTMKCLEENNRIDKRVTSFVIPVGATINMDGTALYEAVAAIFIAQLNGINMSFGDIVVTSITATIASIGAAGVPSAGLITMIIVLNAVGLPDGDVAYILAIDWFLDRFRTAINVLGDSMGAGIVGHLSESELAKADRLAEETEGNMALSELGAHSDDDDSLPRKPTNGNINNGYTKAEDTHM